MSAFNREGNLRDKIRWRCHKFFYPTGVASNLTRFHDRVLFRVTDVSATGMRLLTSLRNKHLQVGGELDATVQLPSVGEVQVRLKIVHVGTKATDEGEQQVIGTRIVEPSRQMMARLGQYILQFGGSDADHPTPKGLSSDGFSLHSVSDAIDYDVVRTEDEYQQVLELRSLAFQQVKGLGVKATPEQMADEYDARSKILVCRYRKRIVATVRLCFHGENEQFEEEQYVTFPKNFPPRHLVVECSRAATHPDFRGNDLFLNVQRYVMLMTIQSGRRYIVQSTYGKLVPIYERAGFKPTGLRCPHPVFPGEQLHLLLGDVQAVYEGRSTNPLMWNTLVPNIKHLIEDNGNIHLSWIARRRLALYQSLTPLYRIYERRRLDKKFSLSKK